MREAVAASSANRRSQTAGVLFTICLGEIHLGIAQGLPGQAQQAAERQRQTVHRPAVPSAGHGASAHQRSVLKSKTPMQAMKHWLQTHPHLFHRRPTIVQGTPGRRSRCGSDARCQECCFLPRYIKNRSEFKELKCRFALVSPRRNAMNNEAKTQPAPRPLRLFRLCGARLRASFQRPALHPATGASRSGSRPPSVKKRHWPSRSTRHAPQPWSSKPSKPTASGMGVPLSS